MTYNYSCIWPTLKCFWFCSYVITNISGKASDGNELYASLWFCWSFSQIIMEIWTPGSTSTYSGMDLIMKFCLLIIHQVRCFGLMCSISQAAYLVKHGFRRRDKRSNMLLVISTYLLLIIILFFFEILSFLGYSRGQTDCSRGSLYPCLSFKAS